MITNTHSGNLLRARRRGHLAARRRRRTRQMDGGIAKRSARVEVEGREGKEKGKGQKVKENRMIDREKDR